MTDRQAVQNEIPARWWRLLEDGRILCELCPHGCVLRPGQRGVCGVRQHRSGKLSALSYGRFAAVHDDPIEKKPLYHFYPGSVTLSLGGYGCNLRCRHCQNYDLSDLGEHELTLRLQALRGISVEDVIDRYRALRAMHSENQSPPVVAWTYNEPLVSAEFVLDAAQTLKQQGIPTALVTAGAFNPGMLGEVLPYIDAYRVDIKGADDVAYKTLSGFACAKQVRAGTELALKTGCHVELVTNLIPGINDDPEGLRNIANWIIADLGRDIPWHLTAYHPAHKLRVQATPVSTLLRGRELAWKAGLKHVYLGNVREQDLLEYGTAGLSVETDQSGEKSLTGKRALAAQPGPQTTLCPGCSRVLIERSGFGLRRISIKSGLCPYCSYRVYGRFL